MQAAFFWFGLVQGAIVFVLAWFLRSPLPGEVPSAKDVKVIQSAQSYSPRQMLATPVFWVLYVMFVLVSASGLMATAQIALIAKDYNVADTVIFLGGTTLTVALARRQRVQRRGAALVRLDFRQYRPREHHGDRLRLGRRRLLAAGLGGHLALGLRALRRA